LPQAHDDPTPLCADVETAVERRKRHVQERWR